MPAKPEHEFTEEHPVDSTDHLNELERVSKDEYTRANTALKQALSDVISQNQKMLSNMQATLAKANIFVASDAMKPKVSDHPTVVVTDPKTGSTELAAKEAKVKTVIANAQLADKKNSNGEAHEAKLGKYTALAAALTASAPIMLQLFQVFKRAMNGEDITGALGNVSNEALIMSLAQEWQNEDDTTYWNDFADFFMTHTAVTSVVTGANAPAGTKPPDPTSADLVMILHYSSILNPVPVTTIFSWASAKEKSDAVDALKLIYLANDKATFIRGLANITVNKKAVPRGIQAQLGELAVANSL